MNDLLKRILEFLNKVPNGKYGNNYQLASELEKWLQVKKKEECDADLLVKTIHLLEGLKKDAEMAISGEWDCTTEEGIETGFNAQIELIDEILPDLKYLADDTGTE